ncbi:DUF6415 family natural product biosynthesis protein [Streptomyces sp. NPDC059340]|uniref:DUF6415 family natural product biosynthesis protein n=1 Tax=Streptomyces sp. NPDC059340 TaxID=3346806 RepID=UPI00368E0A47
MTGTVKTASNTAPVDVAMMRENIGRLLLPDGEAPSDAELATLTSLLRGHMELITPEIEAAAAKLHKDDIPRYCALACVGEARGKLRAMPGAGAHGALAYARKLSRSLAALCDHYEALTGVITCTVCDRPISPDDEPIPYEVGAEEDRKSGVVHPDCAPRPDRG